MANYRKVNKQLRKHLLEAVTKGSGDSETLKQIAREIIGNNVGIERLLDNLYSSAVAQGMAILRSEGHVESIGKNWKLATLLDSDDVDTVQLRRLKRMRGEAVSQIHLAHKHGRIDDATYYASVRDSLNERIAASEAVVAEEVLETSVV